MGAAGADRRGAWPATRQAGGRLERTPRGDREENARPVGRGGGPGCRVRDNAPGSLAALRARRASRGILADPHAGGPAREVLPRLLHPSRAGPAGHGRDQCRDAARPRLAGARGRLRERTSQLHRPVQQGRGPGDAPGESGGRQDRVLRGRRQGASSRAGLPGGRSPLPRGRARLSP